ncbi:hypothetical protein LTR09_011198 [Extremus antarcticus]|uniref:Zn(2)-C6 fungal-type domain-containing protein n=1 Tax=Extremus antarcticus TaxID=702011 RepID=A0AAJ0D6M1_9PEZI|nr:hypothetical protein LTR09_011198 [Extremus antarcticus]
MHYIREVILKSHEELRGSSTPSIHTGITMTDPQNISNVTVYHFVSDPGHKETLSGRVLAACANCRRKKMKCSGRIPCATCIEKGLICEGLVARKKPTRSARSSRTRDSEFMAASLSGTNDGVWETHNSRGPPTPETKMSECPATTSFVNTPLGADSILEDPGGLQRTYGYADGTIDILLPGDGPGSYFHRPPATHSRSDPMALSTNQEWDFPDFQGAQPVPSTTTSYSASSSHLLHAAQSLEGQAQVLRKLAAQQQDDVADALVPRMAALPAQLGSEQTSAGAESCSPWSTTEPAFSTTAAFQQPGNRNSYGDTYTSWSPVEPPDPQWRTYQDLARHPSAPSTGRRQRNVEGEADLRNSRAEPDGFSDLPPVMWGSHSGSYAWNPYDV